MDVRFFCHVGDENFLYRRRPHCDVLKDKSGDGMIDERIQDDTVMNGVSYFFP